MNETELVERCGKGDNLARKQLYERYAGQLMAVCVPVSYTHLTLPTIRLV